MLDINLKDREKRISYYQNYRKPKLYEILEHNIYFEYAHVIFKNIKSRVVEIIWKKGDLKILTKEHLKELYDNDYLRTPWFAEERLINRSIWKSKYGYVPMWMHKHHVEKYPGEIKMLEAMPMKTDNNPKKYTTDELCELQKTKQILFKTPDENIQVLLTPYNIKDYNSRGYYIKGYDVKEWTQFRILDFNTKLHKMYFNIENIMGTEYGHEIRYLLNLNYPKPNTTNTLYKYVENIYDYPDYNVVFNINNKEIKAKILPEAEFKALQAHRDNNSHKYSNTPTKKRKSLKSPKNKLKQSFMKVGRYPNRLMKKETLLQIQSELKRKEEESNKRKITKDEIKEERRRQHKRLICVRHKDSKKILRIEKEKAEDMIRDRGEYYEIVDKKTWKEYKKRIRRGLFYDGLQQGSTYTGVNRKTRRKFVYDNPSKPPKYKNTKWLKKKRKHRQKKRRLNKRFNK